MRLATCLFSVFFCRLGTNTARTARMPRRKERVLVPFVLAGAVSSIFAAPVDASRTAAVCDAAARRAAAESGVPVDVLKSITRTETGRTRDGRLEPWPWAVNMQGEGRWFDTMDAALAHVLTNFNQGARNFDVGCFQINYRWHGAAFESLRQMFDPLENARYAASFLARLHDETRDWSQAAGAYHSRTPRHAKRYRARFDRIFERVREGLTSGSVARTSDAVRKDVPRGTARNGFRLLQRKAGRQTLGSLVPLEDGSASAMINLDTDAGGI